MHAGQQSSNTARSTRLAAKQQHSMQHSWHQSSNTARSTLVRLVPMGEPVLLVLLVLLSSASSAQTSAQTWPGSLGCSMGTTVLQGL